MNLRLLLPLLLLVGAAGCPDLEEPDSIPTGSVGDDDDDATTPAPAADADGDGWDATVDCDDTDPTVHPGATELCDGVDQDCDPDTWAEGGEIDADGDGFVRCLDCDDLDATVFPGAQEIPCNGVDEDCLSSTPDAPGPDLDGDGVPACVDCDDAAPEVGGGTIWLQDLDGDGWGDGDVQEIACEAPPGMVERGGDCNDLDPLVHPQALEECPGPDRDCDGQAPACATSCRDLASTPGNTADGLYWIDSDGPSGPLAAVEVWCSMSIQGGGWTLAQRTIWDWQDNQALLTGQFDWYHASVGSPSPGETWRLAGKHWQATSAQDEHLVVVVPRRLSDGGSCGELHYLATGVIEASATMTTITGVISTAPLFPAPQLTTTDSGPMPYCVSTALSVPWFHDFCCDLCPTDGVAWSWSPPRPALNFGETLPDANGNLVSDVCGGATPQRNIQNQTVGANAIEYYVR